MPLHIRKAVRAASSGCLLVGVPVVCPRELTGTAASTFVVAQREAVPNSEKLSHTVQLVFFWWTFQSAATKDVDHDALWQLLLGGVPRRLPSRTSTAVHWSSTSLSWFNKVVDILVVAQRQIPIVQMLQKTTEISQ